MIAAVGNNGIGVVGVAYGAKIMPIRATDAASNSTFSLLASGLTWAADHGADVANISYSNLYMSSTMQAAAQYLRDRGGITVVSANNNAIDEGWPNTTTMITVSATDQNDALASFSSWGSMVDLAAPGVSIQTTTMSGGYGSGTGTSFATPIVAGAVALVMAANHNLAPSQVESALFSNATDLGSGGYDTKYGWGRVNVASAVQATLGAPASDTTKPTVAIASPTGGTLAGLVPVSVSASDNVGVTRVELYAGSTLIATDAISPYSFSWDTTKFANSGYSLSALAYDAAGNVGTSAPVAVTVSNVTAPPPPPPPPTSSDSVPPVATITNPAAGSTVNGMVSIGAKATDNVGVTRLSLYVDGTMVSTGNGTSVSYKWNTRKAAGLPHDQCRCEGRCGESGDDLDTGKEIRVGAYKGRSWHGRRVHPAAPGFTTLRATDPKENAGHLAGVSLLGSSLNALDDASRGLTPAVRSRRAPGSLVPEGFQCCGCRGRIRRSQCRERSASTGSRPCLRRRSP